MFYVDFYISLYQKNKTMITKEEQKRFFRRLKELGCYEIFINILKYVVEHEYWCKNTKQFFENNNLCDVISWLPYYYLHYYGGIKNDKDIKFFQTYNRDKFLNLYNDTTKVYPNIER